MSLKAILGLNLYLSHLKFSQPDTFCGRPVSPFYKWDHFWSPLFEKGPFLGQCMYRITGFLFVSINLYISGWFLKLNWYPNGPLFSWKGSPKVTSRRHKSSVDNPKSPPSGTLWAKKAAISDQTLNILPQNTSDPNICPPPPNRKLELYTLVSFARFQTIKRPKVDYLRLQNGK